MRFIDGIYRTISTLFGTLYTIHGDVDGTLYPIFFILMENEQKTTFARAFEFTKPFLQSFNEQCVVHVDCQMEAIGAFKDVFGCRVRLCLFHQNQSVWKAVSRYKLAAAYNSMTNKRLHIWIRRLLSLPFLPERDIVENFAQLFEHEALNGPFCVENEHKNGFRDLVAYYKRFWIERIPIDMWCQSSPGQRTNNRCEGFHNGLRHTIGIVHPNPFVTIQLPRRVDEEANSAFTKYLCGEDARRARTRTVNLDTRLATVIERYIKHRRVIPPKQFLDQIAIVFMEYYHMEKWHGGTGRFIC